MQKQQEFNRIKLDNKRLSSEIDRLKKNYSDKESGFSTQVETEKLRLESAWQEKLLDQQNLAKT